MMTRRNYFMGFSLVALIIAGLFLFLPAQANNSLSTSTPEATPASTAEAVNTLYPVRVDGKWGYIDNTGQLVIQPQYALADEFSNGLAMVQSGGQTASGKWGYINV